MAIDFAFHPSLLRSMTRSSQGWKNARRMEPRSFHGSFEGAREGSPWMRAACMGC